LLQDTVYNQDAVKQCLYLVKELISRQVTELRKKNYNNLNFDDCHMEYKTSNYKLRFMIIWYRICLFVICIFVSVYNYVLLAWFNVLFLKPFVTKVQYKDNKSLFVNNKTIEYKGFILIHYNNIPWLKNYKVPLFCQHQVWSVRVHSINKCVKSTISVLLEWVILQ
jgi:hypothetical protein